MPKEIPGNASAARHKAVQKFLDEFKPKDLIKIKHFPSSPSGAKINDLDATQYENLFEAIAKGITSPIPQFILTQCDTAALDGLNAFYAGNTRPLFKELRLDINLENPQDADLFISKLKLSLNHLSKTNLSHLVIKDEKGY